MKKYILIILTVFYVHVSYSFTPGEHPDLKELLNAAGKNTYIKDFEFKLKPGEETQFTIELDKRTLYEWFANMKNYKHFRLTLFNNYGYTIYSTKDKTVGVFKFSTKSNKEQKYILNVKNTSDQDISTTVLLTTTKKLEPQKTIVQNPKLEKILNESNDNYLKDFNIKVDPNTDARYSVVLSKNKTYSLALYQNEPKQFEISLYENKSENLVTPKSLVINNVILYNSYDISQTGIYHLIVKNNSKKQAETVVLLSLVEKRTNVNNEPDCNNKPDNTNAEKNENYYFIVDDMPKFNGKNSNEFKNYIQEQLKYPQEAINQKIEGKVLVQFIVDKNGYIKNAKVVRGVQSSLDQEALRIIYSSPKWQPGIKDGQPVDVVFTFPVEFNPN